MKRHPEVGRVMKNLIMGLILAMLLVPVSCAPPAPAPVPVPAPAPGPIPPPGTPPGPITPVKAHYSAGVGVVPSKTVYMPGEEIELELVLNNESIEPVFVGSLPPSLIIHKTGEDPESIKAVHTFPAGTDEVKVGVNEKVSYGKLTWDQKDESGNQVPPGWYNCEIKYTVRKESPPPMDWGAGSGKRIFLIQYPQGAMEKTIEVNQSQTVNDITVTLERIDLNSKGMMVQ